MARPTREDGRVACHDMTPDILTKTASCPIFASDPWRLLRNRRAMTAAIGAATDAEPERIRARLWQEFLRRGSVVRGAARAIGVTPHVFDASMARLYGSDAFLYELALWNGNLLKRRMRAWTSRWITRVLGSRQRVLAWGDGLGFDTLALAEAGHDVTVLELPGPTRSFAECLLAHAPTPVRVVDGPEALASERFDAVVCLDVLEHVPDLHEALGRIRGLLRPGGVLIAHAPFYFVHRAAVTHLRVHRHHSGSLALFRRSGFRLVDGQPAWAPLAWARDDGAGPRRPLGAWLRLALALPFGLFLATGRFTPLPAELTHVVTRLAQPWFLDDMLHRGKRGST